MKGKSFKKAMALALCGTMVMSMAACGSKEAQPSQSAQSSTGTSDAGTGSTDPGGENGDFLVQH